LEKHARDPFRPNGRAGAGCAFCGYGVAGIHDHVVLFAVHRKRLRASIAERVRFRQAFNELRGKVPKKK